MQRNYFTALFCALLIAVFSYPYQVVDSKPTSTVTPAGSTQSSQVQNGVAKFAFSPDGKTLASVGADARIITIADVASGKTYLNLAGRAGTAVTGVAFSPDGKTLASVDEDTLVLWDVTSGQERLSLPGHVGAAVTSVAFSPDGKTLASGSQDARIIGWDLESGSLKLVLTGHSEAVTGVAFSPDGKTLASGSQDSRIKLWDVTSGQERLTLPGTGAVVTGVAFSPDGKTLASGSQDSRIKLWDVASGQERLTLPGHPGAAIIDVAFGPDGNLLASVGDDFQIILWDMTSGQERQLLVGHDASVAAIAFTADRKALASVAQDGQLILWDVATGVQQFTAQRSTAVASPESPISNSIGNSVISSSVVQNTTAAVASEPTKLLSVSDAVAPGAAAPNGNAQVRSKASANQGNGNQPRKKARREARKGIKALAVSPDGTLIGSASDDDRVRILNAETGQERSVLPNSLGAAVTGVAVTGAAVTGVAFNADGKRLVSVGRDTVVRSWDVADGQQRQTFQGHEHPIRAIAASPDGRFLASAGEETRIMLWDATANKLGNILSGHTDFVNTVAFSPDGKILASGGADARILLWDVATGKSLKTLLGHSDEVNGVAFSPNGKLLASAGEDTQIIMWDVATGQQVQALTGHTAPLRAVAFSQDGQTLASAGEDTKIIVWEVATGKPLKILTGTASFINALKFSPDGKFLIAGSEDDQITVWNVANATKNRVISVPKLPKQSRNDTSEAGPAATLLSFHSKDREASASFSVAAASPSTPAVLPNPDILERVLNWLIPAAEAQSLPDPNQGPGGPILIITFASSTFGKYYAEILRNEGLNAFAVADTSAISAATLANYDVVILAAIPLSAAQVTTLTNWVSGGGNLIAMRPDPQLASLLGLTAPGLPLSNGYLLIDTSKAPGNGIVNQTIQFHGAADRYTLNGASSIATLYTNATTATNPANPAVTLRSVGAGQAAAFAYDLATSIVYTRQGNPAWSAQERDGFAPIRSDDKFYGNATGDPQPDWVDLTKVSIPQADEQQRLLANLILEMNLDKKPLPRFWYFPNGKKAVVIMTGDDHANGGTAGRFDQFKASSPTGCSVANWECVRGTSYIYTPTPLTNAQAAAYNADGFEVGLHINTNCSDFTSGSLATFYTEQINAWTAKYSSIPPPITQRHHCLVWSDWITAAKTELTKGIRLDTTYYFWPPSWILNRPGLFTGSGMPMRLADLDGTLIDVYHAVTQMTDESGQQYPFTIDSLLDKALGPEGYYGAFTVNAHTDSATNSVANDVVSSALARNTPIVSSRQMLTWLDGRNSSSFGALTWNGNALSFTVTAGSGANGLQVLLPVKSPTGLLATLTLGSPPVPVSFTNQTIKGVDYAAFTGAGGSYVATYAADTTAPTVTSKSPAVGATGVDQGTAVTATFSEAMDAATITGTPPSPSQTFELRNASNVLVQATVTYNAGTRTATLTPSASLAGSTTYTATVKGGAADPRVKDLAGNALAANVTWSFTTAAQPCASVACSAWSSSTTPGTPSVNDPNAVTLGVKFRTDLDGLITGIRFYQANAGTFTGTLWSIGGQALATGTVTATGSGWKQVTFPAPVAITANTVYVASYHAPNGNYAANNSYFASTGVDNGPIHLLRDGVSGGNGVYAYSASSTFPTNTFQASNYWVDVVFTTSTGPDTTPPTVTAQSPLSGATGVSTGTTVTATFSEAMDAATISTSTFELRAGTTLISATVTYAAATNTATLTPSSALVAGTVYTATVKGGTTDPRVKDLAGNALAANVTWSFTTAATSDTTPPTVTATSPTNGATGVSTGTTVTATFSEAMDAATISTSTFELQGPSGLVPATVTFTAGTNTATLTPSSALVASTTYTATVKGGTTDPRVKDLAGNALATTVTSSFTTAAGGTSTTIWPPSATPAVAADSDTTAVELGVKFRSNVNGFITGIRFYKSTTNTGTHVGNLWTSTGTLLASATFSNETASGWQQVSFANPVAITANTVYVASYHAPVGRYSVDQGYFATSGFGSGPLYAFSNSESGGNGVYVYGSTSAFPNQTFNSTNYWVDVVSTTSGLSDTTPPAIPTGLTATGSTSGVALAWTANSEGDLAGYNVYRSASGTAGSFTRLNAALLTSLAYEDTSAPGTADFYQVTAVDTSGNESAPSATVSATLPVANRLANPGFELDTNSDTRPDSWTTNTRVTRSNAVVRSGSFAMRHFATNNAGYTISQTVTGLAAATTYTFGGWVNIPATGDAFTFTLRIRWRNAANTVLRTDSIKVYNAATGGWNKATPTLAATPAGTTNALVDMVVSSLNAVIYVDDFALR